MKKKETGKIEHQAIMHWANCLCCGCKEFVSLDSDFQNRLFISFICSNSLPPIESGFSLSLSSFNVFSLCEEFLINRPNLCIIFVLLAVASHFVVHVRVNWLQFCEIIINSKQFSNKVKCNELYFELTWVFFCLLLSWYNLCLFDLSITFDRCQCTAWQMDIALIAIYITQVVMVRKGCRRIRCWSVRVLLMDEFLTKKGILTAFN